MKIWLTGEKGMLADAFVKEFAARQIQYVGTDKNLDITQKQLVLDFLSAERPTHIVNCAAYTAVDQAEDEPELAERVNGEGPRHLAEAARDLNVCLIHFSSDYVFDGAKSRPYLESDTPNPISVYGRTKLLGEQAVLGCKGLLGYVIRASWLFGDRGKDFVKTMAALMQAREELKVVDDQVGRPTYAGDLAAATLKLTGIGYASTPGRAALYHFANRGETTWYQFAQAIWLELQRAGTPLALKRLQPIPSEEYPTKATRPRYSVLDTSKIESAIGTPRPWQAALETCMCDVVAR